MWTLVANAGGIGAILARAASFAATIAVIGGAAFRWNAARGSDESGKAAARAAADAATWIVSVGGALFLIATPIRLFFQAQALTLPGDSVIPMIGRVLQTTWGHAAEVQVAAAIAVLAGAYAVRRGHDRGWRGITLSSVVLAACPAYMGHANGTEGAHNTAMIADALHVLAAGGWAGGVATLAICAAKLRAQVDGPAAAATLIDGFKRLALTCAAILVVSGLASSWIRLTAVSDLFGTVYGRLLLFKVGLVGIAATLGWLHSRTAAARTRAGSAFAVARTIANEAAVMLLVIAVTALLAGSPPPGME